MATLFPTFTFARPNAAPRRTRRGAIEMIEPDLPRFDHDGTGQPLGLLVEAGAFLGQGDAVALAEPVHPPGPATVLHQVRRRNGRLVRRAHYSRDASRTIDVCLKQVGHHQRVAVIAGFVQPRAGRVRALGEWWTVAALIGDTAGTALEIAPGTGLIDG